MADQAQQARKSYDRMSKWYDLISGPFDRQYTDAGLRQLAARPGDQALEIGYGTGYALVGLAKAVGETGKVRGIDISDKMRAIALKRVRKHALEKRVELSCGNAVPLPYKDNFFDDVYLSFTLELFTDAQIPKLLNECLRTIKPGGQLGVVAMSTRGARTWMLKLYSWFHRTFPSFVDCRPINASALIRKAGFKLTVDLEMKMWGLPVAIVVAKKPG
jgi:demethylmenaquinone methyltransferase/2-methoxy-6-polyprenyl-1,4-benzoquinol methylase